MTSIMETTTEKKEQPEAVKKSSAVSSFFANKTVKLVFIGVLVLIVAYLLYSIW
jgi:hypothetical protein